MKPNPAAADFGVNFGPDVVRFERLLPGPIERVWQYLVDSDKRGLWLASGALEPRVGGTIELRFENARLSSEPVPERYKRHAGVFEGRERITRFEPPRVLAFTWTGGEGVSEVTFELAPVGDRVRLLLTHSRLSRVHRLDVSGGWHVHLEVLESLLEGHGRPAFWSLLAQVEEVYAQRDRTEEPG